MEGPGFPEWVYLKIILLHSKSTYILHPWKTFLLFVFVSVVLFWDRVSVVLGALELPLTSLASTCIYVSNAGIKGKHHHAQQGRDSYWLLHPGDISEWLLFLSYKGEEISDSRRRSCESRRVSSPWSTHSTSWSHLALDRFIFITNILL